MLGVNISEGPGPYIGFDPATKRRSPKAMRDTLSYILSPIALFAFFAAGTLTTLTGPFGTYLSMGMLERAAYWYTLIAASIVLSLTIRRMIDLKFKGRTFLFRAGSTTVLFTLAFTPCIIGMNYVVLGVGATEVMPIWKMYLVVISVPLTVNPLVYLVLKLSGAEPNTAVIATESILQRPRIFERLSEDLGEELIRMSVQDHFVHFYLAEGSEKLRMRFADAMTEVEGVAGLRVHRSHWVAQDAVAGHAQDGAKIVLKLRDGSIVPVSRNYRADVEAAGLLANANVVPWPQPDKPEQQSA